jgi:hypothetical protein
LRAWVQLELGKAAKHPRPPCSPPPALRPPPPALRPPVQLVQLGLELGQGRG